MNKNIKDYLHLYLGCELQTPDCVGMNLGLYYSTEINEFNGVNVLYPEGKVYVQNYNQVKPILRPLGDMTEEECSDVYTISRDRILHESAHDFHVIKNKNGFMVHRLDWMNEILMIGFNGQIYSIVEDGNEKHIEPVRNPNEITKYLLSKHFDLFGLIPELAFDKAKINSYE